MVLWIRALDEKGLQQVGNFTRHVHIYIYIYIQKEKESEMAIDILFLCNKTHKDPTLKAGCIKPYVFIRKITILAPKLKLFIGMTTLPGPYFFMGMGGVLGKITK